MAGKTVLVTGAGRGIGSVIAERFGAEGARVIVHYRTNRAGAERIAKKHGVAVKADLTSPRAPQSLAKHGPVDVLINNAVFQPITPLAAMTADEWQRVMDTNVNAVFRLTAVITRTMPPGGSVIHIASIEGSHPAAGHAHYATSKAALIMHAKAAALELGPRGIRVNSVSPGLVERDGLDQEWPEGTARWRAAAPLGRLVTPGDIADACVFLASPMSAAITGHDLVVDAGVTAGPTW